jgi:phage host-nuclease inhibitor protein Gam
MTTDTDQKAEFRISDAQTLAWYAGRLARYARDKVALKSQYEAMTRDIEREEESLVARFGVQAEAVLRDLLTQQKRKNAKSIKFLQGTIGFRTTPEGLKIEDKEALMESMQTQMETQVLADKLIHQTIDATEFKRYFTVVNGSLFLRSTGEAVELEGLELTPAVEKMYTKTSTATDEGEDTSD